MKTPKKSTCRSRGRESPAVDAELPARERYRFAKRSSGQEGRSSEIDAVYLPSNHRGEHRFSPDRRSLLSAAT